MSMLGILDKQALLEHCLCNTWPVPAILVLKQMLFYVLYRCKENSVRDYFSDNLIILKKNPNTSFKMIFFFIFGCIRIDRRTGVSVQHTHSNTRYFHLKIIVLSNINNSKTSK